MGQVSRIRERANLFVEHELRSVQVDGVLPAHGGILAFLFQQDAPVPMKNIVERVGRVKSTVTGMVNTLELHGYVEKFQSSEDGRIQLVRLTQKGQALKPAFDRISGTLIDKLYGEMPEAERARLVELLREIENNLQEIRI